MKTFNTPMQWCLPALLLFILAISFAGLAEAQLPGDVDGDGNVDRDDLMQTYTFLRQPASACAPCDVDGDGFVSIVDLRGLLMMCTWPGCASESPDNCPDDPAKTEPGVCGCGEDDRDSDNDGVADCIDSCPDTGGADVTGCPLCFGVPAADPAVCRGNGICVGDNLCDCSAGFGGEECAQVEQLACFGLAATDPAVCSANGQCIADDLCRCADGWTSNDCDVQVVQQCFSTPWDSPAVCSGNGQCVAEDACLCDPGWNGSVCQVPFAVTCDGIANSSDLACSGNGICTRQDSCVCADGYLGQWCETAIDYSALTCDGIAATSPSVCNGHGSCIDQDVCVCEPQYIGATCNLRMWSCYSDGMFVAEENQRSGCVNGVCAYQDHCLCDDGWAGDSCDLSLSPWVFCAGIGQNDPMVCSGRGDCQPDGQCACPAEYHGNACESVYSCSGLDAFDPNVCSGHGNCGEDPGNPGLGKCDCHDDRVGVNCEIAIGNWVDGLCQDVNNNGVCDPSDAACPANSQPGQCIVNFETDPEEDDEVDQTCAFFDEITQQWSSEGCMSVTLSDGRVECRCSHM